LHRAGLGGAVEGAGPAALAFLGGVHRCIVGNSAQTGNEKVFHCAAQQNNWKTKNHLNSAHKPGFLEMKKYFEKIEK
jgi:hypothetical protein